MLGNDPAQLTRTGGARYCLFVIFGRFLCVVDKSSTKKLFCLLLFRDIAKMNARFHSHRLITAAILIGLFFVFEAPFVFTASNSDDLTEIPLEELNKLEVYSASKFSQKVSEAPASISIITATDIHRYGYRTFSDILRSIPGFYVTYDRNYDYLGVRGFGLSGNYNTSILVLVDGQRLNENVYSGAGIGTDFPISIDLIARIEVVRGPGSALYGTNAFLAVINVITKRGNDFNGSLVSLKASSGQTYQGDITHGQRFSNGMEILFSGSYMDSKGTRRLYYPEFDKPESNNGIAQDGDTDRAYGFFADASYKDLGVRMVYQSREKRIPTASYETVFNDKRNRTTDMSAYLEIKYDHKYHDYWRFLVRSSLNAYEYSGSYVYDQSSEQTTGLNLNEDIASGRWWSNEVQATRTIGNRHHLTAGTELQYNFRALQKNYDDEPNFYMYTNSNPRSTAAGAYIQGEMAVRNNLLLSGGLRFDHYTTFGGTVNPRFAVVYSPWEKTTTKLLYGHAYRAPNVYEMFYELSFYNKSNPELQPEKIRTVELVLEQYLTRKIRVSGSGYFYHVRQQIVQQADSQDGLLVFQNAGSINAKGLELQLEGKDISGIDTSISYIYQRTEDSVTHIRRPNSPNHMAQIRIFIPAFKLHGGAGFEMQYMSSRKSFNSKSVKGNLRTNLTYTYNNLFPGTSLSAGFYNLFNQRYSDPASIDHLQDSLVQDGRSFRVKLDFGFHLR
jgi:outer membrane receptor for ferrienterochelin and colicins